MATYSKRLLSGSTDGKGIKVVATATPGTLIHTAVASLTDFDEVWVWAYNGHTGTLALTIEFGGVAVPDNNIIVTLASKSGLVPIIPGLILQNGAIVRAFAASGNLIVLSGFVNRITA